MIQDNYQDKQRKTDFVCEKSLLNIERYIHKLKLICNRGIIDTIEIGTCCKIIIKPNTNVVLLAFSVIGIPERKFSMSNALKSYQASIIYLNCPSNKWYLNGIKGLGDSLQDREHPTF